MGIRINRTLGYGYTITNRKYKTTVTTKIRQFYNKIDSNPQPLIQQYVEHLLQPGVGEGTIDAILAPNLQYLPQKDEKLTVGDIIHIVHNPVVDGNDTENLTGIIFTPIFNANTWHRYDDDMDYADHMTKNPEPCNTITHLTRPIYPYDGNLMNKKTGELLPAPQYFHIFAKQYQEGTITLKTFKEILNDRYQMTYSEYKNFTFLSVPKEIQILAEWVGLTEPGVNLTHKLSPVLADYWG